MRYVVTGSTGCLGMSLCRMLKDMDRNNTVIGLGRNQILGQNLTDIGVEFVAIDLSERERLKHICQNADVIFHCAALSTAWGRLEDFYNANVVGTRNIIDATPKQARLIHVSSPSVYFNFKDETNISEDTVLPLKNANAYIETKKKAEQLIFNAIKTDNLKSIIIRARGILGPYDRALMLRILKLYRKGKLPLVGKGDQQVDITYVDNVSQSLINAAHADNGCLGNIYNITNGESMSLKTIISKVFKAMHKPVLFKHIPYYALKPLVFILEKIYRVLWVSTEPRLTRYTLAVLTKEQTLSIEKAKRDLNYLPMISIDEGIQRYVDWSSEL